MTAFRNRGNVAPSVELRVYLPVIVAVGLASALGAQPT